MTLLCATHWANPYEEITCCQVLAARAINPSRLCHRGFVDSLRCNVEELWDLYECRCAIFCFVSGARRFGGGFESVCTGGESVVVELHHLLAYPKRKADIHRNSSGESSN